MREIPFYVNFTLIAAITYECDYNILHDVRSSLS